MDNKTRYSGRVIRRWVLAAFQYRNAVRKIKGFTIVVRHSRYGFCSGKIGTRYFGLSLPRNPAKLSAADLSFTIDYLVLLSLGFRRRDMSQSQKTRSDEIRTWAKDLPLPSALPMAEEEPSPSRDEQRKGVIDRRVRHAKKMLAKYELLEATITNELLHVIALKKKWAEKVKYYKKRGVS